MNIPDYKNRGLRATDAFTASGIYFAGRGSLTVFLTLISPPIKGGNQGWSLLFGLAFMAFGIILFKLGSYYSPKSLYRTGSSHDWDVCLKRTIENAKRAESGLQSSSGIKPETPSNEDIDIQYHW
jgi:hypothetical protein